jgi:hypothetical protein
MELEIVSVRLLDGHGDPLTELRSGNPLRVEIGYFAPRTVESPIFAVAISTEDDQVCVDLNTANAGVMLPTLEGEGQITLSFERLDLNGGQYHLDVGAYRHDWGYAYDLHWHGYSLPVLPSENQKGFLRPPHRWQLSAAHAMKAGSRS